MELFILPFGLLAYILAGRLIMRRLSGLPRELLLAALNVGGVFWCFFYLPHENYYAFKFAVYLGLFFFQYMMFRAFADKAGWLPWLAFFSPIAVLIIARYVPMSAYLWAGGLFGMAGRGNRGVLSLVGVSYLAFRCSRLVLEVRNNAVPKPNFWEYLNFSFFLPTMPVGPINTYANYRRGFAGQPCDTPVGRAAMRVLVGAVKYQFLGAFFNQLTYSALLLDDHPHGWIDLAVAAAFYYLHLYCNFSGFCDMAIGAAGLIGIPVAENFQDPFAARNIKEFWNRWHITLSQYMRDVVFSPLSKFFARLLGPANVNHAVALTAVVVFLLVGVWHGVGWNYAAFGAVHALGTVVNHYYTIALKKRLGRDGFKAYNANPWIHAAAVVLTFGYVAASLFFFANSGPEMQQIFAALR